MKKTLNEGKGKLSIANKNGDKEPTKKDKKSEIEELLEAYKLQNPKKYKIKKDRGEFDKYLKGKEQPQTSVSVVPGVKEK